MLETPAKQTITHGFTLIEILVALAILAIALTAILKVADDEIRGEDYLQSKTVAHWVAMNTLAILQTGVIDTANNSQLSGQTVMLNQSLHWQATITPTANKFLNQANITVTQNRQLLANMTGYLYNVKK